MIIRFFFGIILFVFFSNSLLAETYIREYTYNALQADSKSSSRITAVDHVRTLLFEKIGSHIQQIIKISEDGSANSYARVDVEAVIADLTKINILEEKWDGETYYLKAEIEADTQRVLDALKEYKENNSEESRQQIIALKANEKALQKSRVKITRLRRDLEFQKTSSQNKKLLAEYIVELEKLSTEDMFAKGFEHNQHTEYNEAIYWYRKAAKKGNVVAQTLLGMLYMNGQGVDQDFSMAINWFRKSAEKNEAIAQYYLGMMYLKGEGIEQNDSIAADWLHKSAEQDNALAQYHLGQMYFSGKGVEQKYFMAVHWFQKAAEQREVSAQFQLGNMYAQGKGVTQNDDEARYWYHKAAEQGLSEAQQMVKKMDRGTILN